MSHKSLPRSMIIFGATSTMAIEVARLYASDGYKLALVGRDPKKLEVLVADLRIRGAIEVETRALDLTDTSAHEGLVNAFFDASEWGIVLVAHGILGDQSLAEKKWEEARRILDANFLSQASLLTHLSNRFETQGCGVIAVIGSVAGDRGRQSNYVYGSAKGALALFTQGLRNRLYSKGVDVVTIKPGFVSTTMTAHLKQGPLFARAEVAGQLIKKAIDRRKDVAYVPGFWWAIMLIIKHIPERIFKKLKL